MPYLPAGGKKTPTLKQLEAFARATHTPFGFLFLPEPPEEPLPIPDFRTVKHRPARPSPDLLDTIYAMQRRQDWLREERIEGEADPLEFVGNARVNDEPTAVGQEMRRIVGLDDGWAGEVPSWQEAVSELRRRIEGLGVMAVINGIVGNNTHRKLDVDEFRGFALTDRYAPLIFVNGADAKSAQMFTLAHELAHVWLGPEGEGISGFEGLFPGDSRIEKFCDQAAAEFLVPARELRELWRDVRDARDSFERVARHFKVRPIVAGRRAMAVRQYGRDRDPREPILEFKRRRVDTPMESFSCAAHTALAVKSLWRLSSRRSRRPPLVTEAWNIHRSQVLSRNRPISSAAAKRSVTSERSTNGIWPFAVSSSTPIGAFSRPTFTCSRLRCDRRIYVRRNGSFTGARTGSSSRAKSTCLPM